MTPTAFLAGQPVAPSSTVASRASASDRVFRTGDLRRDAGASLVEGVATAAGAVGVWSLPGSDRTDRPDDQVKVSGTARCAVFDSAGRVLFDEVVTDAVLAVPARADRLAVHASVPKRAVGRSGWLARTTLARVASHAFLAPGAVVSASTPSTRRRRQAVDVGSVRAGTALLRAGRIDTMLSADSITVAIVVEGAGLDRLREGSAAAKLFGLHAAKAAAEPSVVTLGNRAVIVVPIVVDRGARPVVRIRPPAQIVVAGVVGSPIAAFDVETAVRSEGVDAIDPGGVVPPLAATAHVTWTETRTQTRTGSSTRRAGRPR